MILLLACSGSPEPTSPPVEVVEVIEDAAPTTLSDLENIAKETPPPPAAPRLEAAVLTSVGNADALVKGSDAWVPVGDPEGEGLLLRFDEPVDVGFFEVSACSTGASWTATVYVNGSRVDDQALAPGDTADVLINGLVKSVFVRMSHAEAGACLATPRFLDGAKNDMGVLPPRRIGATVEASSTLEPADAYHTLYLVDSRTDFGWVEGAEGTGVGETLTITLDEPVELHGLTLWNGYHRSADHHAKNARLKKATLSFDTGSVEVAVPDTMRPSKLEFPPVTTRTVTLRIDEATAGSRYEDLVISELALIDASGHLGLKTRDDRAKKLVAKQAGTALGALIDQQLETVCAENGITQAKLRSNYSFVVYTDTFDTSTVFDGAWVPLGKRGAWTTVKLYGRRHRITSTYQPYGGDEADEDTRIGGGTLEIARAADLDEESWIVESADMAWGLTCSPNLSHADAIARGIVLIKGADVDAVVAL